MLNRESSWLIVEGKRALYCIICTRFLKRSNERRLNRKICPGGIILLAFRVADAKWYNHKLEQVFKCVIKIAVAIVRVCSVEKGFSRLV